MLRLNLYFAVLIIACLLVAPTLAADFTQAERDIDFIKSCRRQDSSLRTYFGTLMHAGSEFFHLGGYKASIHREGLDRALWLVPVKGLPYANAEEFRAAARGNKIAVGALIVTYRNTDPAITPGTLLLMFDGYRVFLKDIHEFTNNDFKVRLKDAPPDGEIDPVLGTVTGTAFSQANITLDGDLQLYLQLTDAYGEPLLDEEGFVKALLTVPIPGISTDDDSPYRELATPPEAEKD